MPPESQIVARAMQQYGLILADVGSAMYVTGVSASVNATNGISLTWDLNDIFASNGLEKLTAGDFDVVNLMPIVTGLNPTGGPPGSALTINGQNFSGAAGALTAFFGSTPAGLASVISDSQLSVIVPGGSGTVDLTVQSGTNETGNLGDAPNVNAPIFGYGTSALTASDKFAFTAPTPEFQHAALSNGQIILSGTNNTGPGGTYHQLTSTNLQLALANWTVLTNGNFDAQGNFAITNAIGTNPSQFYMLRAP
jgi:hypothetical protein